MSSDSEDDTMEMFKEAMDTQFLNDNMYKEKTQKESKPEVKTLPSLRRSKQEDDLNYFKVTPEFQEHVSKHLTKIIDDKLNGLFVESDPPVSESKKKKAKGGVKLFKDSASYVKLKRECTNEEEEVVPKKVAVVANMEEIEEKCVEAAVDPEHVYSKKDVKHWKSRRKSVVHVYRKGKDGVCSEEGVIREFC